MSERRNVTNKRIIRKKKKRRRKRNINRLITIFMVAVIALLGTSIFKLIDNMILISNNKGGNINISDTADKESESQDSLNNDTGEIIQEKKSGYLPLGQDPNADDARQVQEMLESWNYLREDGKKVAYLTFDDGPSDNVTGEVLDILKAKDVKATFFVLGSMIEKSDIAATNFKRMANEGHAIGNHGYCHRYDILYPNGTANVENFMNDMNKSENVMKYVLGEDFSTRVIRFPGGHSSWNTDELDVVLEHNNYASIDWNSLNGDAEGHGIPASDLISILDSSIADLYGNDDVLVILMHDTDAKETTAQYLQNAIDYLKGLGYEFRTLK